MIILLLNCTPIAHQSLCNLYTGHFRYMLFTFQTGALYTGEWLVISHYCKEWNIIANQCRQVTCISVQQQLFCCNKLYCRLICTQHDFVFRGVMHIIILNMVQVAVSLFQATWALRKGPLLILSHLGAIWPAFSQNIK